MTGEAVIITIAELSYTLVVFDVVFSVVVVYDKSAADEVFCVVSGADVVEKSNTLRPSMLPTLSESISLPSP